MKKTALAALMIATLSFAACTQKDAPTMNNGDTNTNTETPATNTDSANTNADQNVVEFDIRSFTEIEDGTYFPQFSMTLLEVKKGDLVRLNINTTSGVHDFKLDEFGIYEETPTGEITTIEFVADKAGEFEFYCDKPGHREAGHKGTIVISE